MIDKIKTSVNSIFFLLLIGFVLIFLPLDISAQALSPTEKDIVEFVNQHTEESIAFLERVVNINSGTMNHSGVRAVGRLFQDEFDAIGFKSQWIEMPDSVNRAGHLFARRTGSQGKRLLLIGHLDTVFELDSPFQKFVRQDSIAVGPGSEDMKGGDVIILYALKALNQVGALNHTSIIVAFIGDEEKVGAPINVSRKDLIEAAKQSDIALGFEAGVKGTGTMARRGSSGWTLEVSGIRAHSLKIFSEKTGSGAIFEASRILHTFYEEVRGEKYLTFNPGIILGGTVANFDPANSEGYAFGKSNVIAQTVKVNGGLRFISEDQKERARTNMSNIVIQDNLPNTSAKITFRNRYPAMSPTPGNQTLLEQFDQVSRDLGFEPIEAFDPAKRGAADISFIASYVDGLDGLGIYGSGGHTLEEHVNLNSLISNTQRAAILIYRLTRE